MPNRAGGFEWIDGDDNVVQSVELLLWTVTGERVMRPTFGTAVVDLLFEADGEQNLRQLELAIEQAIRQHEPRVAVEVVRAAAREGEDGVVDVDVVVRVLRTNTQRNLVFPYYLDAGEGRA
jgi:phage baseplate assembly protein W